MGQAKRRGSKEQRIKEATERYRKKLDELSQYGPSLKELNDLFDGDEAAVTSSLEQINKILAHHNEAVSVRAFIKEGAVWLDVEVDTNNQVLDDDEKELKAAIDKIKASKKPESPKYTIQFANVDKEKLKRSYDREQIFELEPEMPKVFFIELLTKNFPDMSKEEVEYHAEMIELHSNYPASNNEYQSFFLEKE